jgi:hypothetical protein
LRQTILFGFVGWVGALAVHQRFEIGPGVKRIERDLEERGKKGEEGEERKEGQEDRNTSPPPPPPPPNNNNNNQTK